MFTFSEIARVVSGEWIGSFVPDRAVVSVSTDTRTVCPGSMFIALSGEKFDAHDFLSSAVSNGAVLLCVDRKKKSLVPAGASAVAVDSPLDAYRQLAAFHRARFPQLKTAAVTGSCGKTSTKEAIRAIFEYEYGADHVLATEGNTNNQIGVPRNLLRLTEKHTAAVLEAGTNHFGEIAPLAEAVRPSNALIVSIAGVHLEFLGSLEGVASEKSHIFDFLPPEGGGVIPFACAGNDLLRKALSGHKILTFGPEEGADFRSEYLGGNLHGASFRLTRRKTGESETVRWSVPGAHQAANAAGAAALASLFGISLEHAARGLERTILPGSRMKVSKHGSVTWISDAYNANPSSMKASMTWLAEFMDSRKLILVLGDMGELGESALDAHAEVLAFARKTLPGARVAAVGKQMLRAIVEKGVSADFEFPETADCARILPGILGEGDFVFLKASHSMHLETLEPED